MRQFIIKYINKRVLNEDETVNESYPTWKRRVLAVLGFISLRVVEVLALFLAPVLLIVYPLMQLGKAIIEVVLSLSNIWREAVKNFIADFKGCIKLWNGTHGRGKILPKNRD
jgi:hypothetical protein